MNNEKIIALNALLEESRYLGSLSGLCGRDQWQDMPEEGAPFRTQVMSYLSKKQVELMTSGTAKELYNYFKDANVDNPYEKAMVKRFLRSYEQRNLVPKELTMELSVMGSQTQRLWMKALEVSDYEMLKPSLIKMFELKKQVANHMDKNAHPLGVLMGLTDEGLEVEVVDREFDVLRKGLVPLLESIKASDVQIDDSLLNADYDAEKVYELSKRIVEKVGFNTKRSSYGKILHPVTTTIGPRDSRVTSNPSGFKFGVFSQLHEIGHAVYNYSSDDEVVKYHLWGGNSGGFHEGQARFYENILGKSREFWQYFFPMVQETFPEFGDITAEQFYLMVNKVGGSLKRITADEVTYSLHPIIRYELERDLFDGKVTFDSLPDAWNKKYTDYLGVTPKNNAEGLMQDVHWPMGLVGYFQSYTIGNLYGGQMLDAMKRDIPSMHSQVKSGEFDEINKWLFENIHRHGSLYSAAELMGKLGHGTLDAKPFLSYLTEKYSDIYKLQK